MDDLLTSLRQAFIWGYGHLFIFASAAAVGAGLAVQVEHALHHAEISATAAGATVTVPVTIFLLTLWVLHVGPKANGHRQVFLLPITAVLILLTSFAGEQAPLWTGILLVVLLVIKLRNRYRANYPVSG